MPASTVLARIVAAVIPTSRRAATLAITLLAFANSAHAACDANGVITGDNTAIELGASGCATAPGVMSGTVDSGATVTAPGDGVTSVTSPNWTVANHGTITAGGNGVTGDASFALTNSGNSRSSRR